MSIVCDKTLASDYFAPSCFPNNFFMANNIENLGDHKVLIDISHCDDNASLPSSPSAQPQLALETEIFSSDSADLSSEGGDEYGYAPLEFEPISREHTFANVISFTFELLNDDALAANFSILLSGSQPFQTYPRPFHVFERPLNSLFALRPHFRRVFQERLLSCASVLLLALNNQCLDPHTGGTVLSTVLDAALSESGIFFPVIAVLLGSDWELGHRKFDTVDETEEHARDVIHALCYSIALFGLVTAATLHFGTNSMCNPGTVIGMSQTEFLEFAGDRHPDMDTIVHWLKKLVFNNDIICRADTACTRLFTSQSVAQFMTVVHKGTHTLIPCIRPSVVHEGVPSCLPVAINDLGYYLAAMGF
ncbi:hypothetical protein B0H14DRAFT_2604163 [Mycena olivaceomarginata]|nr:hypothetical protein B0H14DRAFT_2604163 [Mycena olivaceomarginata]